MRQGKVECVMMLNNEEYVDWLSEVWNEQRKFGLKEGDVEWARDMGWVLEVRISVFMWDKAQRGLM